MYVTDQPCHLSLLGSPWQNFKGIQIWKQVHVRLINPHKALYGRAIKHTAVIQRPVQLAGGDSHILKHAEDIRKLEAYKFYILLLCHTHYIIFTVFSHMQPPLLEIALFYR